MIQRIQSLYLTLILLLSVLYFSGSVLNFTDESGKAIKLMITGNLTDQNGQVLSPHQHMLPLISILIAIVLLSAIIIMLFRNRKIQLVLVKLEIGMSVVLIAALSWYAISISNENKMTIVPGLKMAIPLLIFLLSVLALRGILKDERLVKSYDRLR